LGLLDCSSYLDVLAEGGGILDTVRRTRQASFEELLAGARRRLGRMLAAGTTTAEVKSGYGLSVEAELQLLRVAKALLGSVARTFLGAHAVPAEYRGRREAYVDLVCQEMIPRVADEYLAEFCDVFCEEGVFTVEESRRILLAGLEHGLRPKLHADEVARTGGAELAAEVRAVSADHLAKASEAGLRAMAESGTVAVLLPGTGLFLGHAANARRMVELGVPVALGTDLNPGTCPIESMAVVVGLACARLGLSVAEAIVAATVNAAHAIGRGGRIGSLTVGRQADVLVLDAPDHRHLAYRFGTNLAHQVFRNGELVHQAPEPPGEM
jgi:imidazolonepropionase